MFTAAYARFRALADPRLNAVAAQFPRPSWSTGDLLDAAGGRLSDRLWEMLDTLGVDTRQSVLANYPDVLFAGAEPVFDTTCTEVAAAACRSAMVKADIDPGDIGLVIGVTSTPGRLLPSLVCDLFVHLPEIPREAATVPLQYAGCSALARVVDTARWYLTANPKKKVLVGFMEAITPLSPPLPGTYGHFTEVSASRRQETVDVMHGFLFGDAAVGMVLGADGPGPVFGPVASLTNELPEDAELGTVPDGGSDIPVVHGRRLYTLSPDVTARGTHYAARTVEMLLDPDRHDLGEQPRLKSPADAAMLLLHTGSTRILDGLCRRFDVPNDSDTVASSYRVLRDYGNTLGCSTPLMLADPVEREAGEGLVVAFGLSFSAGTFTVTIPEGGWTP
jgi:3-oxoacyl-[acyl-carrier-protein] synthase-3